MKNNQYVKRIREKYIPKEVKAEELYKQACEFSKVSVTDDPNNPSGDLSETALFYLQQAVAKDPRCFSKTKRDSLLQNLANKLSTKP